MQHQQSEKSKTILSPAAAFLTDFVPPCIYGLCQVCGAEATGTHYAASTCEGCKGFFKRSLPVYRTYKCFFGGNCHIIPETRGRCKACRFQKCLQAGMSPDGNRVRARGGRTAPAATSVTSHILRPPTSSSSSVLQTAQHRQAYSSHVERHQKQQQQQQQQQHQQFISSSGSTQIIDSGTIIGGYPAVHHAPRQSSSSSTMTNSNNNNSTSFIDSGALKLSPVPPPTRYVYAPTTQQQQQQQAAAAENMLQQQRNDSYTVRYSPVPPPPPSHSSSSYPYHNKALRLDLMRSDAENDAAFQHYRQQQNSSRVGVVVEEILDDNNNNKLSTGFTRSSPSSATTALTKLRQDYPNIMQHISESPPLPLPSASKTLVAVSKPFNNRELQLGVQDDDDHRQKHEGDKRQHAQFMRNKIGQLVDSFDNIVCSSIVTHLYTEWSNQWMPNLLTARYNKQFLGDTLIYQPVVDINHYMTALMKAITDYDVELEQFAQAIPGVRALDETLSFTSRSHSFLSTFCVTFCEVMCEDESYYAFQCQDNEHTHWLTQTNYWLNTVSPPGALEIFWHMAAYIRSLKLTDTTRALVVAALTVRPRNDHERLPQFVRNALPVTFFSYFNIKSPNDWAPAEQIFVFVVNVLAAHVAREYPDSHEMIMRNLNYVFNVLACKMDVLDELMLQSIPFTFDVDGAFDWQHLRNFTANENLLPLDVRQWLKDGWELLY